MRQNKKTVKIKFWSFISKIRRFVFKSHFTVNKITKKFYVIRARKQTNHA